MSGEDTAQGAEESRRVQSLHVSAMPVSGRPSFYENRALVRERAARARNALKVLAAVGFVGAAVLQVLGDYGTIHWIVTGLTLTLGVYSVVTLRQLNRGTRGDASVVHGAGVLGAIVNLAVVAHMGVLTVAALPMVLIVSYRGQLDQRVAAWSVYLLCAIGYAGLLVLALLGILPLTESSPPFATSEAQDILSLGILFEVVLAVAFALSTMFRRAAVKTMRSLGQAHQAIEQRDALIEEARFELEHALDARRLGRFTGQKVGRYLAHDVIGRGASAEIYYARHRDTEEVVALKILYPDAANQEQPVERLRLEATLGKRFESPHLVCALEEGSAEDGSPFVAFELVRGRDLADILRTEHRLPPVEVAEFVEHIARALDAVHAEGIVHADVNPRNILRSPAEGGKIWKLLDFGMALTLEDEAGRRASRGGTPAYASAEQAADSDLDRRSDVCSLGLVAYRALTGRRPFPATDPDAALYQAAHVVPARPSSIVPVSESIDQAIAIALCKDRKRRFQTAGEFAVAFRAALAGPLDAATVQRADAVIRACPWNSELGANASAVG